MLWHSQRSIAFGPRANKQTGYSKRHMALPSTPRGSVFNPLNRYQILYHHPLRSDGPSHYLRRELVWGADQSDITT